MIGSIVKSQIRRGLFFCAGFDLKTIALALESVTQYTLFREETRWPGYYYRADYPKLDDSDWHCFALSRYDAESGEWGMEKAPVYHIID